MLLETSKRVEKHSGYAQPLHIFLLDSYEKDDAFDFELGMAMSKKLYLLLLFSQLRME